MGRMKRIIMALVLFVLFISMLLSAMCFGYVEVFVDNERKDEPTETVSGVSTDHEVSDSKEDSQPLDYYVYTVPGSNKQEITIEEAEGIESGIVVNDFNKVGSLLVYDVKGLTLERDSLVDGAVMYSWVHGTDIYNVVLKCTDIWVSGYNVLLQDLHDEEWCSTHSSVLIQHSEVSTLIGDGHAVLYAQNGLIYPNFLCFIVLENGHALSIEMSGTFTFDEAMSVVENIITNGISVIVMESEM